MPERPLVRLIVQSILIMKLKMYREKLRVRHLDLLMGVFSTAGRAAGVGTGEEVRIPSELCGYKMGVAVGSRMLRKPHGDSSAMSVGLGAGQEACKGFANLTIHPVLCEEEIWVQGRGGICQSPLICCSVRADPDRSLRCP